MDNLSCCQNIQSEDRASITRHRNGPGQYTRPSQIRIHDPRLRRGFAQTPSPERSQQHRDTDYVLPVHIRVLD